MSTRTVLAAVASGVTLALASGCGPTPPQAPLPEAQKLSTSTSDISTACGLAYQSTALDPRARSHLDSIDATAATAARKLAAVYRHNPSWIYQGATVRSIVAQATSTLGACGLHGAKDVLTRATAQAPS
jgi:hypothetical protein